MRLTDSVYCRVLCGVVAKLVCRVCAEGVAVVVLATDGDDLGVINGGNWRESWSAREILMFWNKLELPKYCCCRRLEGRGSNHDLSVLKFFCVIKPTWYHSNRLSLPRIERGLQACSFGWTENENGFPILVVPKTRLRSMAPKRVCVPLAADPKTLLRFLRGPTLNLVAIKDQNAIEPQRLQRASGLKCPMSCPPS